MSKFKCVLCALLCGCFAVTSMAAAPTAASAADDDVSSLEQQLEELEKENEENQKILDQAKSDIADKEAYKEALVNKVQVLNEKITVTREQISQLNDDIEQKQADYDQGLEDVDDQLDALAQRLKILYKSGTATNLELILGASGDLTEIIDQVKLVKTLADSDRELIDEINVKLDELSKQKAALEEDKTELEAQKTTLESDQDEYNELIEENDEILADLYATSASASESLENAQLESDEIEAKITAYYEAQAKAEAEAKKKAEQEAAEKAEAAKNDEQQSSDTSESSSEDDSESSSSDSTSDSYDTVEVTSSGYTWPCPGFYYLSSLWNEDRTTYNHGAIDIAGSGIMGANVVAADDGTVIATYSGCTHNWGKSYSCGCGGGYGNYVMISHAGGKITLYGHLSGLTVSEGETVSKGQLIGYVGSTGHSTGPHLHFECRLNGVKYNPMNEFSGISVYY